MVKSVNGDRGNSVIPISGDDYLFLGRGRHVWLDDSDVYMSGSSGQTLGNGIVASGNSKKSQMNNVGATMKQIYFRELSESGDFQMEYGGYTVI